MHSFLKHTFNWLLFIALLWLAGCIDKATAPEEAPVEPYRTPPVACHESKNNLPTDVDSWRNVYMSIVDKETNKPMLHWKLFEMLDEGEEPWHSRDIYTSLHFYPDEDTMGILTPTRSSISSTSNYESKAIIPTSIGGFSRLGDSLIYINIHYHFNENKSERLRIVYYSEGFEPDSCYRLYYFHNDTLIYKGNDHSIHYPALHIDY